MPTPNRNAWLLQGIGALVLISLVALLAFNLQVNLQRTGLGLGFGWLGQAAGFALGEHVVPYSPSDSYGWALVVGLTNSLRVIVVGLLLATVVGVSVGAASYSTNLLFRKLAFASVALLRNVPLLLQLLFWYFVVLLSLPGTPLAPLGSLISLSRQGIHLAGLELSTEFCALLTGLTLYTGATIAEVVRGGISSVPSGQWDAYRSLGMHEWLGLRHVVLPQAVPAILPGLASQYINLAKNSTLAIAVGYADLYAVSDTTITQTGRAIEGFLLLLGGFLLIDLVISALMTALSRLVSWRR